MSVDTFLFSSQYQDVATIGSLSKFSAGQVYYYPGFTVEKDGEKFKRELAHCLVRETGWEAVMRVRCTKGMRLTNFYGNMFLRGPDLLALPTCHADSTFAIEITHSDALLSSTTISIQAGLLYTTSCGERRIRVHTMCIPVTKRTSCWFMIVILVLKLTTSRLACCACLEQCLRRSSVRWTSTRSVILWPRTH